MSTVFSASRGLHAAPGESARLSRLRVSLTLGCFCIGFTGLAGGLYVVFVAAATGAALLWRMLCALDPAGVTLTYDRARGWLADTGSGVAHSCRVRNSGRFESCLFLYLCSDDSLPCRRHLLLFADALEDGDWRRLRRLLRLQQPVRSTG